MTTPAPKPNPKPKPSPAKEPSRIVQIVSARIDLNGVAYTVPLDAYPVQETFDADEMVE